MRQVGWEGATFGSTIRNQPFIFQDVNMPCVVNFRVEEWLIEGGLTFVVAWIADGKLEGMVGRGGQPPPTIFDPCLPSQTRVKEERTRVNGISKSTDVFLLGSFYFLRFRLIYTSGALQLHSRGLQVSFSFGLTGSLGERDLVRWYERGRNVWGALLARRNG